MGEVMVVMMMMMEKRKRGGGRRGNKIELAGLPGDARSYVMPSKQTLGRVFFINLLIN